MSELSANKLPILGVSMRIRWVLFFVTSIISLLLLQTKGFSQTMEEVMRKTQSGQISPAATKKAKFQSMFIYKFCQFTQWPNEAIQDTFYMGVVANRAVANSLETAASTKRIGGKPVKVLYFSSIDEVTNVHMLYSDYMDGVSARDLFSAIGDYPTLLVTEGYDYNTTMINFIVTGNMIKFQMNRSNIENQNLQVSNTMDKLAVEVSEEDWESELKRLRRDLALEKQKSEELSVENEELIGQVNNLEDEVVTLESTVLELNKEIEKSRGELKAIFEKIGVQKDVYDLLVRRLEEKEGVLKQNQILLSEKTSELEEKRMELQVNESRLASQRDELEATADEMIRVEKQMSNALKLLDNQRVITYGLGIIALVILVLGIIAFNNYRKQRKQASVIAVQRDEMETQRDEIQSQHKQLEEKSKEITDSILYAKRIQTAILPPDRIVKQYLENSFILYKPKDVVAGDFYWMETVSYSPPSQGGVPEGGGGSLTNQPPRPADTPPSQGGETEQIVYFAAADCTGHGVPGAMVSVICNNGLNRSVREFGLREPGEILDKTRELVIKEFEKSEEEVKDGMDISLCAFNTNTKTLKWAGANNPLWIVRKGAEEIEEIKADKQPIGKYDLAKPFTTHQIKLNEGDTIYIFSDGYPDQFGGERGKKYKSGKFKRTLLELAQKPISEQKQILDDEFENWRGDIEQIDDVCVIGVRI